MSQTTAVLQGKVALVTGAGRRDGIGCACALALARAGAYVLVSDTSRAPDLDSIARDCVSHAGRGAGMPCDLMDAQDIKRLVESIYRDFGGIDILVNNAGVARGSPDLLELTDKDWTLSLGVNVLAVASLCQLTIPSMIHRGGGSIINIASISGLGAVSAIPACYTASKFATVGLTKQIALQFAHAGVRCNALCPGTVQTRMATGIAAAISSQKGISLEEAGRAGRARIPAGRYGTVSEVADAVVFLAGPRSAYINGAALPITGGAAPGL